MTAVLDTPLSVTERECRDLTTAGQLQRMLLPASPFVWRDWAAAHSYRPAGTVSGDYLDLVPHGDRLYFMLGDVSGKGVVASLLMAQLHAMFRNVQEQPSAAIRDARARISRHVRRCRDRERGTSTATRRQKRRASRSASDGRPDRLVLPIGVLIHSHGPGNRRHAADVHGRTDRGAKRR